MENKKDVSELIANRVSEIPQSAIHEMTRLSKEIDDVSFLSWAKPTARTLEHINRAAIKAINLIWPLILTLNSIESWS